MRSSVQAAIRVGAIVAAVTCVLVGGLLLASPLSLVRTAKLLIVSAGELAVTIYDPHQPLAVAPVCNCSGDWEYRCDDPQLDYYERVRSDARFSQFYTSEAPPNSLETYLGYANFLRDRFPHGPHSLYFTHPENVITLNLLEMLDEADAGESFLCGEISKMLMQMIVAGGGFARDVGLGIAGGPGHTVLEAWIPELSKWVMIDPDYNVYFSDATGMPLNAFNLHQLAVSGRADQAIPHPGLSENTLYREEKHEGLISMYGRITYLARSDRVSTDYPYVHPKRHPKTFSTLFYGDTEPPEWGWLQWKRTTSEADRFYFTPCRPSDVQGP